MYSLIYREQGENKQYRLHGEEMVIGRAPECDLALSDFSISRQHVRIKHDRQGFAVIDLGSKNGTSINGVRVMEGRLRDGDTILLGGFSITFQADPTEQVILSEEKGLCEGEGTIIRAVDDLEDLLIAKPADEPAPEDERPRGSEDAAFPGEVSPQDEEKWRERMERANRNLKILARVARTMITVQPLHELLEKVMEMVFEHMPVERGFIMLFDEKSGRLVPQVVKRKDHDTDLDDITISKTIADRVFKDKVSILTTDAQVDPRFKGGESIRVLGIRSAICAPLWDRDKVIGIIHADSSIRSKAFTESDLELLTALANYATVAIERARLNEKITRESRVRNRLERYHSPGVVNRIIQESKGEEMDQLEAREMDVTVIFADIVGFTSFSEQREPWRVSQLLNEYFSAMTDEVFRHEGTLDKYVGDALMAVFGAPIPQSDHAVRAIDTARSMLKRLEELNSERPEEERFSIRVGINSGKVIAGDIGSMKRMEYTVLGDTVNVASRIQSSVARPGRIVAGEETHRLVRDRFSWNELGPVLLKGLRRNIEMFEVL